MYFCTDKSTKNSRQELLARTPLHRLIITKGLRSYGTHSRISQKCNDCSFGAVDFITFFLANNSKGRWSWRFIRNL